MSLSETNTFSRLDLARQFIEFTGKNLFLTGKAGTGKTTFLKKLREQSPKRMAVVAPTGVAAINAGGVTIHSFFQLPFGPQIPNQYLPQQEQQPENSYRFSREKLNLIRSIDLLVIDEISMVRADLLDAIDGVLRRFRNRARPFGGVQVLMIGDLQQLAPVVKDDEWRLLQTYYKGPFFFQSKVLELFPPETIELTHIFRQSDTIFIDLLNQIRENRLTPVGLNILQSRHIPNFEAPKGYITLTSHNRQAESINREKLDAIPTKPHTFRASTEGEFPESSYPNEASLTLKPGAQVMFIKNDVSREKLFFNGKIGIVERITDNTVYVKCDDLEEPIAVEPVEWQNYKYTINEATNEIEESIIGKFVQMPLKPAWAITIHKSQGLTFDHAIIDANAAFAHGQVYVALSRCRTLEGVVLASPINERSIISSQSVNSYIEQASNHSPTPERIRQLKVEYEQELITELFDFSILWRQLSYLHKEVANHSQVVVGTMPDVLNETILQFKEKITAVAEKFKSQLQSLYHQQTPVEENLMLQERVQKGSDYFLQQLNATVGKLLDEPEPETDNKAIRKTLTDTLERITKSYETHRACLFACSGGFTISRYLSAKSVSQIEKAVAKKAATRSTQTNVTASAHPELYALLRTWRNNKADEAMMPVYIVMATKTLIEIADKMPTSIKELLKIKGLGKRKADHYGKEILELIQTYRVDKKMATTELDFSREPDKPKEPKIPTWKTTLDLFKMGLSTDAIAQKRGLATTTIEGHLAVAIEKGDIEIQKLMPRERVELIKERLNNQQFASLTEAKIALGNDFSFGEIRMVMAHMRLDG
ncbi:helix-turn-helix domain-containing protein [Alkaliflexus imshenetskii]|uniref:helix-turn-helix domain-containing protein n=1 Tax=Alkaliflexus imshenetskii TaxID=286730 RepID=UPI0004799D70|nr:helix-turn-helix domain-containing protein [Alkaliflexus imshenetskii]